MSGVRPLREREAGTTAADLKQQQKCSFTHLQLNGAVNILHPLTYSQDVHESVFTTFQTCTLASAAQSCSDAVVIPMPELLSLQRHVAAHAVEKPL